jgi:hypothetical protein
MVVVVVVVVAVIVAVFVVAVISAMAMIIVMAIMLMIIRTLADPAEGCGASYLHNNGEGIFGRGLRSANERKRLRIKQFYTQ